MSTTRSALLGPLLLTIATAACERGDPEAVETRTFALTLGDHLAGISDADFTGAKAAFQTTEDVNAGVGPIFNERGCANCHSLGAVGGAGVQIERRFGKVSNGVFDPLANEGGSLRQLFTLGNWKTGCNVPLEVEPADANVHNVGRITTPLFGLGLVDAMPDSFFVGLASAQPSAIRGTVNWVTTVMPNPRDGSQSIGSRRVGRFGWKAAVPNLVQFSADAYVNEMGITTQSCFKGTSITAFATESAPNGVRVPLGCDDNAPPAPPGAPPGTDDAVGSCANGLTAIQEDVDEFSEFMTFLAPPPRGFVGSSELAGQSVYDRIGCAGCHTRQTFTTPSPAPNGVPGNFSFSPFSDFLLHDMGTLGDGIGASGVATTAQMRTAPLWGLRFRNGLLHDGRTTDLATAIRAHDGQGAAARNAFNALSATDQQNLIAFLRSL